MSKTVLQQLNDGDMPGMVRWYDPRLLARVFIRTIVSSVFGQYADQRLIQAATDPASGRELIGRYDFSDPQASDSAKRVAMDSEGAVWIDYICDVGDGFESTYAMAYLLAQDRLELKGAPQLPHGDILIMGGDQCYPQPTRDEYKKRLLLPYGLALNDAGPKRKLFAIPGNHDWYDGLQAFDSLFCSSRDKLSETKGSQIGGWQCQQHRSYWALRLPHNWWIWGTDVQFSKYLDVSQVNYFSAVAAEMGPNDNIIICMAEPSWMLADFQGQDEEENFFKITAIARERGAKVCAILAGDWHHYNRYSSAELGVHFFTAGGGGSFLHPTHVLKNEISVCWPEAKTLTVTTDETGAPAVKPDWQAQRYDVRLKRQNSVGSVVGDVVREVIEPIKKVGAGLKNAKTPLKPRAPKVYPKRSTSLMLSLRNLAFPLFNLPFAFGIGVVYWLVTWQFHTVVRSFDISAGKIDAVGVTIPWTSLITWMPVYVLQATLSMSFALMLMALYAGLVVYVDAVERPRWRRHLVKFGVGTIHFIAHTFAMFTLFLAFLALNNNIAPWAESQLGGLMRSKDMQPGIVREVVRETLEPLSKERQIQREQADATASKDVPPPPRVGGSAQASRTAEPKTVRELVGLLYPFELTLFGGIVGGFIWGCYWVIAGLFGHMHAEHAFAALRVRDYKNFLRIRFEPDQVTIYPIGLDRVPRVHDWTSAEAGFPTSGNRSKLVPRRALKPHLIEEPIVIRPEHVKS